MLGWQLDLVDVAVGGDTRPLPKPVHITLLDAIKIPEVADFQYLFRLGQDEKVLAKRRPLHFLLTVRGPAQAQGMSHGYVQRVPPRSALRLLLLLASLPTARDISTLPNGFFGILSLG